MLVSYPVSNDLLVDPAFEAAGVEVWIKRLDQIHPKVSGNKFYKLKYNLTEARKQGQQTILTFGGAYSNHILATAKAAESCELKSIGIIRGEQTLPLNPTLAAAKKSGMQLVYLNRERYRTKTDPNFIKELQNLYGKFYLIPEGGTNGLAIRGTREILTREDKTFTHIFTCVGTGGTFAGLALSKKEQQNLIGVSSLKGDFIHDEIAALISGQGLASPANVEILTDFHFGGYAKFQPDLIDFIWDFYEKHRVPLDPIYTGKTAFALVHKIKTGFFPKGSKILLIHTGGLQGNGGFTERTGIKLPPSA
ncbi:1-aminocyclopropane-1-carboxylate deaminase/D-cysteine desulfhydrase [Algoriphagus namhaensis]